MKVYNILFIMIVLSICLLSCKAREEAPSALAIPTMAVNVKVSPDSLLMLHGTTSQFTAEVLGPNNPSQTVSWSLIGGGSDTSINQYGILAIGATDNNTPITVRATSSFDRTKMGTATVFQPTVTGVTVSPNSVTVRRGGTQPFSATVSGTLNPPQNVTWTVEGANDSGTTINPTGVLTVGLNETASFTVRATSTYNTNRFNNAYVSITSSTVTSVTVSPPTATVSRGTTRQFTAAVAGNNYPPQSVTWSLYGYNGSASNINSSGLLTVGDNEYSNTLTVRATSTYANQSGTATVTIPTATVSSISINPSNATVIRGDTQLFNATVTGTNGPPQTVTWSLASYSGTASNIDSSGFLTVGNDETLYSLTVRATSTFDTSKSNTVTVDVSSGITSIEVTPITSVVLRGHTKQFYAVVNGPDNIPDTVTWTVTGSSNNSGTIIDTDGLLRVGGNETATLLTVVATSTYDNSKYGTATVTVPGSIISNVVITPSTVTKDRDTTQQFTAVVNGDNIPPQTVNWTVTGGSYNGGTNINATGLLTIGVNEGSSTLTVRAISTYDTSKSSTATVTVTQVTGITVVPATATILRGDVRQFGALVIGSGNVPQTVIWSLYNSGSLSSISSNGLLTVGDGETRTSLTVRATSTYNSNQYGSATVTVPQVTSVSLSPSSPAPTVGNGQTQQFTASVVGSNSPPLTVAWSLYNYTGPSSISASGMLDVNYNEPATSLIVRATSTYDNSKFNSVTVSTYIYPDDFLSTFEESLDGWTLVNGSQTNKWMRGTDTAYAGSYSMYISNNNSTNQYSTGSTSIVHMYRNVTLAANTTYTIHFHKKYEGEVGHDRLQMYISDPSYTPTAGTQTSSYSYWQPSSVWQGAYSNNINNAVSYQRTVRIIFTWANDGSAGTQPPAAIDNIYLSHD